MTEALPEGPSAQQDKLWALIQTKSHVPSEDPSHQVTKATQPEEEVSGL